MERILSVTFGKHRNYWSGNRLIIINSNDSARELYMVTMLNQTKLGHHFARARCLDLTAADMQSATRCHIPCAQFWPGMTSTEADSLYNRLRKTEADVTCGRQPYMAIFSSCSSVTNLWPVLLDCIVACASTMDKAAVPTIVDICNTQAHRHHGVKAVIHLCDNVAADPSTIVAAASAEGLGVELLSATEGHAALTSVRMILLRKH